MIHMCLLLLLAPLLIFADNKEDSNYTILGVIGKPHISEDEDTEYGPIKIRQKFEDWSRDIYDVKGASISYSDDRIGNTGTWMTKGSVIYPIISERVFSDLAVLPSIQWNRETDVIDELTFQLPVNYSVSHKVPEDIQWSSEFYLSAFYLTDFDFDGEMIGAELTYEPIIQIGKQFQTGNWHSLFGGTDITYLLRVIPGLTYSRILSEGLYIDREEKDDMFAVTGKLELGFMPFGKHTSWDIRGTYNFMYDFMGDSNGYSDQWSLSSTWWMHRNIGLELEYQKGDTALTNIEIDLVTLSLRLRL